MALKYKEHIWPLYNVVFITYVISIISYIKCTQPISNMKFKDTIIPTCKGCSFWSTYYQPLGHKHVNMSLTLETST